MLQPIFLLMVLIFLNAVFASAEIAVISMSDLKLRQLCEAGDRRAGKLETLIKQPAKFLATIQVAITLAGFLQSAFAAENFAQPLVTLFEGHRNTGCRGGVKIRMHRGDYIDFSVF